MIYSANIPNNYPISHRRPVFYDVHVYAILVLLASNENGVLAIRNVNKWLHEVSILLHHFINNIIIYM